MFAPQSIMEPGDSLYSHGQIFLTYEKLRGLNNIFEFLKQFLTMPMAHVSGISETSLDSPYYFVLINALNSVTIPQQVVEK
jgi:hypothetical protein